MGNSEQFYQHENELAERKANRPDHGRRWGGGEKEEEYRKNSTADLG